MPNSWFQFKKFLVHQDRCCMKVCTDACLFGAWLAARHSGDAFVKCLDIGTGTGLLSLMYVQKNEQVTITALEIEAGTSEQAGENFAISPWKEQLKAIQCDAREYAGGPYDLVFSNTPFFENELSSPEKNINLARHDEGLRLRELFEVMSRNISPTGAFALLLPYHRLARAEELAKEHDLFLNEKWLVRQTPKHNFFRGMMLFSFEDRDTISCEMSIRDDAGEYTEGFKKLLGDYYLEC